MIKLTRGGDKAIWFNVQAIAWFGAYEGGGSWVVPVGDNKNGHIVKETPEQILALINPPPIWERPELASNQAHS